MSLPGEHKRYALQQVLNAQDWSELWGRVQKHGGRRDVLSTTRTRGTYTPYSIGLLNRLGGLAIIVHLFDSPAVLMFSLRLNIAIAYT